MRNIEVTAERWIKEEIDLMEEEGVFGTFLLISF